MKSYLISFAAGLLVGVIYSLIDVRSPAPPMIALIGLLGILLGEQVVPLSVRIVRGHEVAAFIKTRSANHVFGKLPGNRTIDKT